MGRSRRSYRKSKPTVRVGLPSRKPYKLKPAAPIFASLPNPEFSAQWDEKASLLKNYRAVGLVNNPNLLGARSTCKETLLTEALQKPNGAEQVGCEDSSDVDTDDLRSALGKRRKDGTHAPLQRLTTMQRVYVSRLILKHGNDYQAMSRDMKLNKMQHPPAVLEKLCGRFSTFEKLSLYLQIDNKEVNGNSSNTGI